MSTNETQPPTTQTAGRLTRLLAAGVRLIDCGDGVRGHFCIGKPMQEGSIYWHFWNDDYNGGGWCSAGSVYIGRDAAETKLHEIAANTNAEQTEG